jgi:hypothetical protein
MAAEVGGCGTNMPAAAHFLVIFAASGKNNPQSAFSQQFTRRRWREKGVAATFFAAYGLPQPPFLLNFRCHIHFVFAALHLHIAAHLCFFAAWAICREISCQIKPFVQKLPDAALFFG